MMSFSISGFNGGVENGTQLFNKVVTCLTLLVKQNIYIVRENKVYLYSLRNRREKLARGSISLLFLKLVQITFIFVDNIYIDFFVYIYNVLIFYI